MILRIAAVVLVIALVVWAVVEQFSVPDGNAALPRAASGNQSTHTAGDDVGTALSQLEKRVRELEESIRVMQDTRTALGAETRSAIESSIADPTTDEFRNRVAPVVLEVLREWEAQRTKQDYRQYIETRVKLWAPELASHEARKPLMDMLATVRDEVLILEAKYAPGAFPPANTGEDSKAWRSAWDDLIGRWEGPVRQLTGDPPNSVRPRRFVLDMATQGKRPYEP